MVIPERARNCWFEEIDAAIPQVERIVQSRFRWGRATAVKRLLATSWPFVDERLFPGLPIESRNAIEKLNKLLSRARTDLEAANYVSAIGRLREAQQFLQPA